MKKVFLLLITCLVLEINVQAQKVEEDFALTKNSQVVVEAYGFARSARTKVSKSVEDQLKGIGFCCVERKTDKNATSADYVIIVHPAGPTNWAFRIRDEKKDKEVFFDSLAHMLTTKHTVGKFINKIVEIVE